MAVYLHRAPVDFRKQINGLAVLVAESMQLDPLKPALYVFVNGARNRIKVLYWDQSGFCLWYKRLEKEKFKWPRRYPASMMTLSEHQWQWLLSGYDIIGHSPLEYAHCSG